jgi:hypothetical protein
MILFNKSIYADQIRILAEGKASVNNYLSLGKREENSNLFIYYADLM